MIAEVYLSPHLDDAVLSCGGQIAHQARLGKRVLVVTVCAGDPPTQPAETEFVRELHARWALDNPIAARRAEDLAALRTLRAEALHLDVPDCIYRLDSQGQPLYPDRDALFGALSAYEVGVVDQAVRHLRRLEPLWGATIYTPLGVGHHVDHQLARMAAERWGAPGGRLAYYEDYPYAEDSAAVEAALVGSGLVSTPVWLDLEDLKLKIAAVSCYQSQLSSFFSHNAEMAQRLETFARLAAGNDSLAERIWSKRTL